jgi:hypothetical protein
VTRVTAPIALGIQNRIATMSQQGFRKPCCAVVARPNPFETLMRLPSFLSFVLAGAVALAGVGSAFAQTSAPVLRNEHPVALFAGLDKITGELHTFYVFVDETVQFGALQLTPRVCYDRPPSEPERTTVFLEVDELTLDRRIRRIFTGWMIAESPGLNAIDHPVYDVWLTGCSDSAPETPVEGQQ